MSGSPIYQVFRKDVGAYRHMSYPPQKQQLQLLYPGRLMSNQYHYDGSNIPPEDPEGVKRTHFAKKAFQKAASLELEAFERHLGGKNKVARHPAVEPEAPLEDPRLAGVTIQDPPDANLDIVPNQDTVKDALCDSRKLTRLAREADYLNFKKPPVEKSEERQDGDKIVEGYQRKNPRKKRPQRKGSTPGGTNHMEFTVYLLIIILTLSILAMLVYSVLSK